MPYYRLKHNFTAGELSPLMQDRVDFERYRNGCKILKNMFCATQGPAIRRPGFKFVYDLNRLGMDVDDPRLRMIPFIFNEAQAYAMIFYVHTDGQVRMVLATTNTSGQDGLVVGSGSPCEYETYREQEYTGPDTYEFGYPYGATVTDHTVTHIQNDGTETELTENTDYTITFADNIATVVVTGGTPTNDGFLGLELTSETPVIDPTDVVTLTFPEGWDIEKFDWAQSGDEMYISQRGFKPHIIRRFDHDCWALVEVTFTDQPDDWSDENGWPEKVTFHQQRLVFAANRIRRQTVWMSKAGDFSDFGVSSPLEDSDAVTFTLDSGTQNRIQWITSGKSLHVGTLGNEWTVSGNDRFALTPSNILAQRQTNSGSETNKPLLVGLTTLFVERHGRVVNEFVYDFNYDSYKTTDMAILSPHITEFTSIKDWTYQQTPDSIIWCVMRDGTMAGITYQRQHKVIGWHRHDTQGEFEVITSIPGNTREDDVWIVAKRVIDGNDKYYIEKLSEWFKSEQASDGFFLDSHLVYNGTPVSMIPGFDHLAGETVHVLADGTVHPPVQVSQTGEIELNKEYASVVVGLPYVSEVRPHLSDVDTREGTSRGRTQRITKLSLDFYRTLGGYIGRYDREDGEFEEELPFRVPGDLMGVQVPLYTGWYTHDFPEGFDEESEYFIRQYQPLPMTVRGVVDVIEVHEV